MLIVIGSLFCRLRYTFMLFRIIKDLKSGVLLISLRSFLPEIKEQIVDNDYSIIKIYPKELEDTYSGVSKKIFKLFFRT